MSADYDPADDTTLPCPWCGRSRPCPLHPTSGPVPVQTTCSDCGRVGGLDAELREVRLLTTPVGRRVFLCVDETLCVHTVRAARVEATR